MIFLFRNKIKIKKLIAGKIYFFFNKLDLKGLKEKVRIIYPVIMVIHFNLEVLRLHCFY